MFAQLTVLGPGLLGASLAMAAKERSLAQRVHAWSRSEETRRRCAEKAWCDWVADDPGLAVGGSDLVVVCTPVATIVPLLREIAPSLAEGARVTDVGSTKARICAGAGDALGDNAVFVGAHPMAGSEKSGMEHARADLFEGAACFVTPDGAGPEDAVRSVADFWTAAGTSVTRISPAEHDRIVAHISHLPHVLAVALCDYLSTRPAEWRRFAGGGLADTSRVASGDPGLWKQILEENAEEVTAAIEGLQSRLEACRAAIAGGDADILRKCLRRGKTYRDRFDDHP